MLLPSFKRYHTLLEAENRYRNVDWSQKSPKIAKDLGVARQSVVKARKQYAPETINPFQYNKLQKTRDPNFDPTTIDWSKPTITLAKELNITPSYVSVMRKEYAPETIRTDSYKKGINWDDVDWKNKSTTELANEFGVGTSTVSEQRAKRARKTLLNKVRLYDWVNIDWQKDNDQITNELFSNVIAQFANTNENIDRYFSPIFRRWFVTHYVAVKRKIYSK